MLDVLLCCAAADREVTATIAQRLEACAEARVWFEECGVQQTLVEAWETGLRSAATLLALSPASVPARVDRAFWEPVLNHIAGHGAPPLGAVLLCECAYPRLLERSSFFRWADGPRETLRAIERWIVSLHASERPSVAPVPLSWFEGRESELERLWETLVDVPGGLAWIQGPAGAGKTSLAQTFARQAEGHFRDVLWASCGDRPATGVERDIAAQLNGAPLAEHRLLLILDDLTGPLPSLPPPGGRASALVTARTGRAEPPSHAQVIALTPPSHPPLEAPHEPAERRLWQAMSVCRPQGFALDLAARLADIEQPEAGIACEALTMRRLVDPLDHRDGRFRLSEASRAAARLGADIEPLRRRHAELLHAAFKHSAEAQVRALAYLPELAPALDWACAADWNLAIRLAWHAYAFLRSQGRLAEGAEALVRLRDEAERRGDQDAAGICAEELSWVLDAGGAPRRRPEAAAQLAFEFSG
jgi:hypothetical protein